MKQGWETKKLDDACEIEYGTRVVNKRDGGSKYPVYGGGGATFFMDEYNREDRMVIARFAMSEQCTRFVKGKFFLNDSGLTVTPKNKSEIREDFFDYLMFSLNDHIYSLGRGTAQKNLDVPAFRNINISYPKSLPEQQRIVSVLDEAFASIAQAKSNAERNLVNARELFESVLEGTFESPKEDWEEKKLEDFFSIKHGFAFKGEFFTDKGKYVLLTPGNFYEEGGYRDRGEKQKYYIGDFPKDYLLKKGDILVAMTEQAAGLLGSPIIIPESNIFLHNQRLGLIIYKEENKIDTKFLFHLFNTKRMRRLIHQSASGVKVRHTSPSKILEINAFIPPLVEQRAIVGRLAALAAETGRLEEIYQQKVESLEELKKSVLGKAFAGNL